LNAEATTAMQFVIMRLPAVRLHQKADAHL
jgi:hypothetical protein